MGRSSIGRQRERKLLLKDGRANDCFEAVGVAVAVKSPVRISVVVVTDIVPALVLELSGLDVTVEVELGAVQSADES